jgi:two-component system NtrC family response regulator
VNDTGELAVLMLGVRESSLRVSPALRDCVAEFTALDSPDASTLERVPSFDAIVVDLRGDTGSIADQLRDAVRKLLSRDPHARAIALVPEGDTELGAAAVDAGAWDVLYEGEWETRLGERLRAARRLHRLLSRGCAKRAVATADLPPVPESDTEEPAQMVGTSDAIRRVFSLIRQVATADVPVLLTGESGTGKELAALAIHERSARCDQPFVAINCAAIPETLLESELFGIERGAFTGATQSRRGRFEAAQGGTIFLDEVGDLAPALQAKLLRFLQDHVVERVGGRRGLALDVRVNAATNRDLLAMVQHGEFREDLYFRLAVFTIDMPPLRGRGEDVVLMARYFLQRYARESGKPIRSFTPEAVDAVLCHPWPGNVRELINRVRRAVVVAEASLVTATDLGLKAPSGDPALMTLREARREAEERCVRSALRRANWNKVEAARAIGISRTQLYELMFRHRIPHHEQA